MFCFHLWLLYFMFSNLLSIWLRLCEICFILKATKWNKERKKERKKESKCEFVNNYDFRKKQCSVRLYIQLFVGGLMSYLRYLCLFLHIAVQHILCFCIVFLRRILYRQVLWIVHIGLPLRYSLTFMIYVICTQNQSVYIHFINVSTILILTFELF